MANEQLLAQHLPLDESQVQDGSEAVRIATVQYLADRRDLLWVSNLQSGQLASEADLIKLRALPCGYGVSYNSPHYLGALRGV